ncbi:hypothetical protein D3C74_292620 [compost metagenome]
MCASVYEAIGDYQQALQYTYVYAELDCVKETDEGTPHWIGLFEHWAKANVIVNKPYYMNILSILMYRQIPFKKIRLLNY